MSEVQHDTVTFQVLLDHPLPWRMEQDWTWEVYAADGHLVAKYPDYKDAEALIAWAETERANLDNFEELEKP